MNRGARLILASILAALAVTAPRLGRAQPPTPGAVVNGLVTVVVYVTLGEDVGEYHPVPQHPLVLHRPTGDSSIIRTDDAGAIAIGMAPGSYRLTSREPYRFRGRSWWWDVPLPVRANMPLVELRSSNAQQPGAPVASGSGRGASSGRPGAAGGEVVIVPERSVGLGTALSVLVPGGGQLYGGKTLKGLALLVGGVGAAVGGYALDQSKCEQVFVRDDFYNGVRVPVYEEQCGYQRDAPTTIGLVTLGAAWIYGIATAPGDVREWNARQRYASARVVPTVLPGRAGTEVGLALRW